MELELTDENFEAEVLQCRMPVLVDFYADWCGPCQMARPILKELEKKYQSKVKFGKLDVDTSPAIAGKYRVMNIPTVILFRNKEEVRRQVGFAGREEYIKLLKESLEKKK